MGNFNSSLQISSMGKTHASHYSNHELELKSYKKPYTCDGCKEQGFGSRYRCEDCDFDLHEHCMFTSKTTHHDFFPNSTFKFFHHPPRKCNDYNCGKCERYCDACGKPVKGFVYHSEKHGWDLHPCCSNLPMKLRTDDGVEFKLCEKVKSKCNWCKKKNLQDSVSRIRGWSYVSKCKKYHFHVYCVTEMMLEGWRNGVYGDCLSLEKVELSIQRHNRRSTGNNKYVRIVKFFLKAIVSILLGDPTITFASLLVDLVV